MSFARPAPQRLLGLALAAAALAVRWRFVDAESGDYRTFLSRWWAHLAEHGHLAALGDASFSNYNTPYLALLALATYLPVPALVAIKAISVAGDLALASVGSRIVAQARPGSTWAPVLAFGAVLALPTVVMNSAVWAQCDSLYAAAGLACVLFCMRGRPWPASAWFGVALALKLQAIFLLPLLLGVLVINRLRVRALLAAPAAFLACLVPALLAGRGLASQLAIYPLQVTDPSGIGGTVGQAVGPGGGPARPPAGPPPPGSSGASGASGGGFTLNDGQSFTHNAPTPYAWLPPDASAGWKYAGLAVAAAVVMGFGAWLLARRRPLSSPQVLLVAAASTLVIPLLLPEMHERYFYLAEVLLVLAGFVHRRWWWPAAALQAASCSTYLAYLLDRRAVPLGAAAALAVAAGVAACLLLRADLRGTSR